MTSATDSASCSKNYVKSLATIELRGRDLPEAEQRELSVTEIMKVENSFKKMLNCMKSNSSVRTLKMRQMNMDVQTKKIGHQKK